MQIDVSLNLPNEDIKNIIIDYLLKNNSITAAPESIKFNTEYKTIDFYENRQIFFTGCTISGYKVIDFEFK